MSLHFRWRRTAATGGSGDPGGSVVHWHEDAGVVWLNPAKEAWWNNTQSINLPEYKFRRMV